MTPAAASLAIIGPLVAEGAVHDEVLLTIADGQVVERGRRGGRSADQLEDGERLAPGLIDVHCHGAGGADVMDGPDAIVAAARTLADHGVTAFVPTAVSAPRERVVMFLRDVAEVRRRQRVAGPGELGSAVLGANLEGPALDPAHRGAHDPRALVGPAELTRWWDEDHDLWDEVRIVTLAPELPGGLDLVRRLVSAGRIASVGHTGASFEAATAAFDAGAASTTHLFNGMTGIHHRQPGAALAALLHPRARVELIADGIHVVPALWPLIRRLAGPERIVLVSDAIHAAGAGDGEYVLGGLRVLVREGRATLEDGTIAGSTLTLDRTVATAIAHGFPPHEAIAAATVNPADLLGLPDRGRLRAGERADLIVVDGSWTVRRVMMGGRWLS